MGRHTTKGLGELQGWAHPEGGWEKLLCRAGKSGDDNWCPARDNGIMSEECSAGPEASEDDNNDIPPAGNNRIMPKEMCVHLHLKDTSSRRKLGWKAWPACTAMNSRSPFILPDLGSLEALGTWLQLHRDSFSALVLPQTHGRAVTLSWCQVPNATTSLKQKAFFPTARLHRG